MVLGMYRLKLIDWLIWCWWCVFWCMLVNWLILQVFFLQYGQVFSDSFGVVIGCWKFFFFLQQNVLQIGLIEVVELVICVVFMFGVIVSSYLLCRLCVVILWVRLFQVVLLQFWLLKQCLLCQLLLVNIGQLFFFFVSCVLVWMVRKLMCLQRWLVNFLVFGDFYWIVCCVSRWC